MKNRLLLGMMAFGLMATTSCKDEIDQFDNHGSASIVSFVGSDKAYMGDSIAFDFEVKSGGVKINQAKVQLYYGEEMVSEAFYSLKADGKYSGKVLAPYLKDVPDGEAKVILRVQNERFSSDSQELTVAIERPKFASLDLKTVDGQVYKMTPVAGKEYEYSVLAKFPAEMIASIEIPAYSDNGNNPYLKGNPLKFGMDNGRIAMNAAESIYFEPTTFDSEGRYEITFNTKSFEGSPFPKFGVRFDKQGKFEEFAGSGNVFYVESSFEKDEIIKISGMRDEYAAIWKNPMWFNIVKEDNLLLHFRGRKGNYKLTLDKGMQAIYMELTDIKSTPSTENAPIMLVNGDAYIGFPEYSKQSCNWSRFYPLCPLTDTKHQLVTQAGKSIRMAGKNFKFFGSTGWSPEWGANSWDTGKCQLNNYFIINSGDGNLKNNTKEGEKTTDLTEGYYFVITVETNNNGGKSYMTAEQMPSWPMYSMETGELVNE